MKYKLSLVIILFFIIAINIYSLHIFPDPYTQAKIQLSSIHGSTGYIGRLNLWHLLVQNNDWENASLFESKLNQDQVINYKLAHQPLELQKKINEIESDSIKTADDYIELAKAQTLLGQNQEAINSIKKAYQLDPIRSDVDKLFYSTNQ